MRTLPILLIAILFIMITSSCEGDESDCDLIVSSGMFPFQDELDVFDAANAKFTAEQTRENCEAYVQSARQFVAAMKSYSNCLSGEEKRLFDERISTAALIPDNTDCDF